MPGPRHATLRRILSCLGLLALVVPVGCRAEPANPPKPAVEAPAVAARFVADLQAGKTAALAEQVALPLEVREQEWQLEPSGEGEEPDFHLGPASDRQIGSKAALASFLPDLVKRSRSLEADPLSLEREEIDREYLHGAGGAWSGLEVFAFVREEGDLEHLLIVGVDAKAGRVRALYLN